MPGLSQLKKFNKDILSIGDEVTLRAQRGEKPVRVPIPSGIKDEDDSEDFVLGMPENPVIDNSSTVDEDLSDLTGLISGKKSSDKEEESEVSYEAPDLSSLLSPVDAGGDDDSGMPDLSMFMDEPEEPEEEIIEEEPEEISVADMSLEALLSGAGFDGSEGTGEPAAPEQNNDDFYDDFQDDIQDLEPSEEPQKTDSVYDNLTDIERDILSLNSTPEPEPQPAASDLDSGIDDLLFNTDAPETQKNDAFGDNFDIEDLASPLSSEDLPSEDFGVEDFPSENLPAEDLPVDDLIENLDEVEELEDLDSGDFDSETQNTPADTFDLDSPATSLDSFDISDIPDFSLDGDVADNLEPASSESEDFAADDFGVPVDLDNFDLPSDNEISTSESAAEIPVDDFSTDGLDSFELPAEDFETEDTPGSEIGESEITDSFDAGDFSVPDFDTSFEEKPVSEENAGLEDFDTSMNDFNSDSFELPSDDNVDADIGDNSGEINLDDINIDDIAGSGDTSLGDDSVPDFDASDLGDIAGLDALNSAESGSSDLPQDDNFGTEDFTSQDSGDFGGLDLPDDFGSASTDSFDTDFDSDSSQNDFDSDFGSSEFNSEDFNIDDSQNGDNQSSGDIFDSATSEIPDFDDMGLDDAGETDSEEPLEAFDTTGMDDVDFGIQDAGASSDFEMGASDEFSMEGMDFEIPGFSDVGIAKENTKVSKKADLDIPDYTDGLEGDELPPNTLSDEDYKLFLKNLNEYPLNVRLAFENLIVQDEFTDDAEFEVIEKILKKAPARQVASTLEKMLDTSIPVPRDYEHRTAEEYEAYKKSIQYQLRNKILPGLLCLVLLFFVGWGIFTFGKNCVYKPLKASSLYKQGYALLENEDYPQAEMKFMDATKYRLNKKWFFKYARGYRDHKMYDKSALMYNRILNVFKHDKEAGLEYADMELSDRANYERAEEIVRREVLDYHVNDPAGDLMLGDIFLEWGTEKDPEKLDLAAAQYQKLLMTNGDSNVYSARMMRYFIRKDNLHQVLNYKDRFFPKEKNLEGKDWTELSGYLLEKFYGYMSPSDEYLRAQIEDLRALLLRAVKTDKDNPIPYYNLGNYYVQTNEVGYVEEVMTAALEKFNNAKHLKKQDLYKFIDTYRLLGENFIKTEDVMRAQEQYTNGIALYTLQKENAGFEGNERIGLLYADLADINYFRANDYENALLNYTNSVDLGNDNAQIRYRIGYINYKNKNYKEALNSFIKAGEDNSTERNLILAKANSYSMRSDDDAAEGYYEQLISGLDDEIAEKGIVFPQTSPSDADLVTTYLYAANNYGVTLHRIAKRTGNSSKNGQALVQLERSIRAWDALTRNQETLVRLGGSNLAQENMKYITNPISTYEPAIYIDIPKTLTDTEDLK